MQKQPIFLSDNVGRPIKPGDILFNKGSLILVTSLTPKKIRACTIYDSYRSAFKKYKEPIEMHGMGYIVEPLGCINLNMSSKMLSKTYAQYNKIVVEYKDPISDETFLLSMTDEMEKYFK